MQAVRYSISSKNVHQKVILTIRPSSSPKNNLESLKHAAALLSIRILIRVKITIYSEGFWQFMNHNTELVTCIALFNHKRQNYSKIFTYNTASQTVQAFAYNVH